MSTCAFEIGILGAGPAAARAAELLADAGAELILLDPKAPWEKPCGGGLTAGTLHQVPELAELCTTVGRQPGSSGLRSGVPSSERS